MQVFTEAKHIYLDPKVFEKARAFAKAVTQTTNYRDSHQSNSQKIGRDHFISKLGEEAVKLVFEDLGQQVKGPDYTIYKAKQKSWQADLFINSTPLAVKTQSQVTAKRFTVSWIFQAGIYRCDSILKNPEAWVCFVSYNPVSYNQTVQTCTVYPPCQIKELSFREPRLEHLKASKKAVYLDDLPFTTNLTKA